MDTVLQRHGWGCGKPGNASYQGIRKCANHLHRWKSFSKCAAPVRNCAKCGWVDGTYRGAEWTAWVKAQYKIVLECVARAEGQKGFAVLPHRWVVERTLAWLNQCRRLSKDDEELPTTSETFVYVAMTRLMLKRLAA